MAAIARLPRHFHSAISTDPLPVVALRIGHDDGLSWVVGSELTVTVGGISSTYSLDVTISELADLLQSDGIDLLYQNSSVGHLSARALLRGTGDAAQSNGDHLRAHSALLWAFLGAYAAELDQALVQVDEGLQQLFLGSADAEFLDYWGDYFAVPRLTSGEVWGLRPNVALLESRAATVSAFVSVEHVADLVAGPFIFLNPVASSVGWWVNEWGAESWLYRATGDNAILVVVSEAA